VIVFAESPPLLSPLALVMLGVLSLALGALALHFLVLQPRKRRRPLLEALELLESDDPHHLEEAERLLVDVLTAGLPKKDIATARFALAYVRARRGRLQEAAAVLADLEDSGDRDPEAVYLHLWVQSRLEGHEKVETLYSEHKDRLKDMLQTKLIAALAFLERARSHWTRKEVQGAMHYFGLLRELGELVDEIPSQIEDHEVVLGIVALHDKDVDEARQRFAASATTAAKEGRSTTQAEIGRLLCDWIAERRPDIDAELFAQIKVLIAARKQARSEKGSGKPVATCCAHCGQRFRVVAGYVGERVACKACHRRFVVSAEEIRESEESAEPEEQPLPKEYLLNDDDLLLRNVLLWHAVSLVHTWLLLPQHEGLPPEQRDELGHRTGRVAKIDPEMGAARLLEGLISYYFAADDEERKAAVALLQKAADGDVHVPEVLNLLDRERRLAELERDALRRYLGLVRGYLTNPEVPQECRERLWERLSRFDRFQRIEESDLPALEGEAAPSVHELRDRGVLMRRRVTAIVKPKLKPDDLAKVERLVERLEKQAEALSKQAKKLENTECGLLAKTGEFLLEDEEPLGEAAPADAKEGE
jgi:hypothetical protein